MMLRTITIIGAAVTFLGQSITMIMHRNSTIIVPIVLPYAILCEQGNTLFMSLITVMIIGNFSTIPITVGAMSMDIIRGLLIRQAIGTDSMTVTMLPIATDIITITDMIRTIVRTDVMTTVPM